MPQKKLPTALIAVDICIFKIIDATLCVYLAPIENELYKGLSCLPGALIHLDETAEGTATRVIEMKTSLEVSKIYKEQLYTFSRVDRDKRSRVVSLAYLALYSGELTEGFVPVSSIKRLAYDHDEILSVGVDRLQSKLHYTTIIQKAISKEFTYSELQAAYECILGKQLDKRNFRKKIESLTLIRETGKQKKEGRMRPAMLYTFRNQRVENIGIFG
jgi:8-oxo-dGTP diphosphatase